MPLKIIRRTGPGTLYITGTIRLPHGESVRVRSRAGSNSLELAREEAAALEAQTLRDAYHGKRRSARSFAEAVESYLTAELRAEGDRRRLRRIMLALGDVPLTAVDQEAIYRLQRKILAADASPATVRRGVITPVRAVLNHAHELGWCDVPKFKTPRQPEGRTRYLLPGEAEQLVDAATPHLRPLIILLLDTGARMSEALDLDWRDVDLAGARVIFWRTKSGKRRVAALSPRTVALLASLAHRDGAVFRWTAPGGRRVSAYADRERKGGGQIKTGWRGALRRAGIDPEFTPHDLRHTWASWHYAQHRDLLALKAAGGWSSVTLVERYAHLLPADQTDAIRAFWGVAWHSADTPDNRSRASC